jgi:predicted secreted Zn-dependent protease
VAVKLPRLPAVPPSHAELQIWWQQIAEQIEAQEERQDELIGALETAVAAIQAAQEAANVANAAAETANAAAAAAQTAASGANDAIEQIEAGNFDLAAVTVDGVRFVRSGTDLVVEP